MRLAMSTVCLPELSWQRNFDEAAAAGFRFVELLAIRGWVHVDPQKTSVDEVREGARRSGVEIIGLHAGGIDGSSDAALASSVECLKLVAEMAAKLSAGLLVFSGMKTPEGTDAAARPVILKRIAKGLAELEPLLARRRIRLGLENHYRCQIETLEDYQAVFAEPVGGSPWVGATVDTGHFTSSQVDPAHVARALGRRVYHVHVKDHIGTCSMGLGHGHTDNAAVVRALRESGYAGFLSTELEVEDRENAVRYVHEAKPYLEKLLAQR
jgi:sugar phosphate isomerase/epimerase